MLKKILIGVVVLILLLVIIVALQPSEFSISRAATIHAPPAVVFAQVNDFHKWEAWSPWAKLDPNSKTTFAGPTAGEGAKFAWAGNSEVGEGKMTITKSKPTELILIDLEFIKPFAGTNLTEFTFRQNDNKADQTQVTWTMSGHQNFISKAMCLIMNMDKMVGPNFEKGLASMKAIAESEEATASQAEPATQPPVENQ